MKHKETIFKFVLRVLGEDSFKKYLRTISKGKRKGVVEYIEQAKDVSDSYVIARAGLIKLSNKQIK